MSAPPRPTHLVVRAGARAARQVRDEGLAPEAFDTLVGASGGPKWLVLRHLDDVLIDRVIRPRRTPLDVVGSSIGSFRHACFAQKDPHDALRRFTEAYTEQAYEGRPSMEAISIESQRILRALLGDDGAQEVVGNRLVRSHVLATRLRRDRGRDRGPAFQWQMGRAAALNLISRRLLATTLARVHFHSGEAAIGFEDFSTTEVPLSARTLPHALLASGSIPLVMAGVDALPEVGPMLFDGGVIDYHFDFRFRRRSGLVLFPHFFDRITPGWFDKALRWRRPRPADLEDVVMIAPSDAFVASLPGGRIPDRNDFLELDTDERIRRWRTTMDRARALADEFQALLDRRGLGDAVRGFDT